MLDKALVKPESSEQALARYGENSLPARMALQHPIHGLFGVAFEELGGIARLVEWASEKDGQNYGSFLALFTRMAPPPGSNLNVKQMNIQVDPSIKRTILDGHAEEVEE